MIPQPPPGQGPIDPRSAFTSPPPPGGGARPPQGPPNYGARPPQGPPPWGPGAPPPYPPMMPPVVIQPPRERGFAKAILMTFATSIFGLSLALNAYLLLFSGLLSGGSSSMVENVIAHGDRKQKIAVIPINGVIDASTALRIDRIFRSIENDATVRAIVLEIDSPGGTVTASDEIYNRIHQYRTSHNVPVVASMGSLAASGGYYIACAADQVYAQPTTWTGNIGVLMPGYNVRKLAEEWGVQDTTLHSTGAHFKDSGSMFREPRPDEIEYFQDLIDQAFDRFKEVIAEGRGPALTRPLEEIANGKIYTARDAKDLGLIDDIKYPAEAYDQAAQRARLSDPYIVRYVDPPSALDILLGESQTPGAGVKLGEDGVTVKVDMTDLHNLLSPRPMYLWRGY